MSAGRRSLRAGETLRLSICLVLFVVFASIIGCDSNRAQVSGLISATSFDPNAGLTLTAHAERNAIGEVIISEATNLLDGLKMWIEVKGGHLPLGAPKDVT